MQLREEVRTANTYECPINDWLCRYFENGGCTLRDKENCSSWRENVSKDRAVDK